MQNTRGIASGKRALRLAAFALVVAACTKTDDKPLTAPPTISGPNLAADIPFNAGDKCIAADAFLGGFTNGVNDSLKLASNKLCTSQDIKIATAIVDSISTDGGINYVKFTGQNTTCKSGDILFLQMAARVAETATSQRTDVGIWIGLNGGNARVGQCNHYNLVSQGIALGQTVAGVTNVEGDQCGDMNAGDTTLVQLGKIQVLCQGATAADSLVHVGSCLGWTQPGGDQICPQPTTPGPNGFRFGTTPGTGSKCNCEGFNVPIRITQFAKLEVVKACQPSQIPGATFDLLINGATQAADAALGLPSSDNVACAGTTGARSLGAGTNTNPGQQHNFGEGDFAGGFTGDDFLTTYACVNRGTNVSRGSGSSRGPNNITLQPNDDVVCTFTNTLKPKVKLVKALVPTTDAGLFDFTLAGTSFNNSGNGYGNNGTTGFQVVSIGSVSFSEAAHTGTSLSDYTTTLACDNGKTVNPNNNTSGTISVAAGDQITCTFTNTRKPRLKVVKATIPTSDPGKFDFTIGATSFNNGGQGYGNGEGTAFQTLAVGNVNISEVAHTGTNLTQYTSVLACDSGKIPNPNNNTSGTVSLAAGDVVTCTFTNTKGAAVKVIKATVPTTDPGKFDFTIAGTGFNNSNAGYGNSENTGFQPVAIGSVIVGETGHTGTVLTNYTSTLGCVNAANEAVTINPNNNTSGTFTTVAGDLITCTFTNTRIPEVKLVKDLVPNSDAGLFDLKIGATTFTNTGAGYGDNGTTDFQKVAIGSLDISELGHGGTLLTNYNTTLSCDNSKTVNPNNNTSGTIALAAGDRITCTFVNTRKPEIKLVKALVPAADAGTFDLTIGATTFNNSNAGYGDGGNTGFQQVAIGSLNISEAGHGTTALVDYTTALACDNGKAVNPNNNTSGTVNMAAGDKITCTFTNTRKPQLKLVKVLDPTNDAGKFDFTIAGNPFNNSNAGYGHNGTTGFQTVSIGSVSFSEAGHTGTALSEYSTTLACLNAASQTVAANPNATNTAGSVTLAAGQQVTCTFTNKHAPRLGLSKTPDPGGTGYNVSPGQLATFTITLTDSLGGGPALNAAIIDTLPADVGDWTENPDQTECTITALAGETAKRLLQCNGATGGAPNELVQLNPGTSFTVIVQATVPTGFLQIPPDPNGPTAPIEIDPLPGGANLADDPAVNGKDWATPGLISCLVPIKGCDIDLPTGTSDNSFGQGTSEDDAVPTVVTGSIPNNKSDLLRFYIANERVNVSTNPLVAHDILYLAWERVQAPNGTTNMDFELNQSTTLSSNGVTPVRTAGDILIKYDLSQGGTNPVLGFHRWILSGTCEKNGGKAPCWGPVTSLVGNPNVAAAINLVGVSDPIPPNAPRSLDALTFGEARVDLQATGIFAPGACQSFGRAYLKSRSSDSFAAEIKDFIAPIPISVSNCQPRNLDNRVWARASNFAPPPNGALNDWFSDTGQIHVADASATGSRLSVPTNVRLAQAGLTGMVAVAAVPRSQVSGARQRSGTPWPPAVASESGVGAQRSVAPANSLPRPRLVA